MIVSRITYINDPPADELYLRAGPDSPGGRQRNRPLPSGLPKKYVRSVKPVPNHAGKRYPPYAVPPARLPVPDITDRFLLAQLAVQVRQGSRSPRFDTAVPGNEQRGKHTVTYFLLGRNRWRDERILPFTVRVSDSSLLGGYNFIGFVRHLDSQIVRQADIIIFAQRTSGWLYPVFPKCVQSSDRFRRTSYRAILAERLQTSLRLLCRRHDSPEYLFQFLRVRGV